ncbi:hypothetical protein K6V72_10305 [Ralstonia insidiosa]|jgi:hypothetical protein|uniref:hypothetical protein n=1 Tax=Ralstonia TaxID=48736 RepID=UPI000CEF4B92|nr:MULTISPECIES: hypothetical protein [Ralstonia]KAB0471107.1 hypothetical protein F7R11_00380 [Ralstonia insidiosa]MBY4909384.1 hypothetical protein [Ralstonia insidiosa]MDF6786072.1 hypothetical protein [Escherichia coli]MDH6643397.1 hypothetical protein [Ralstonia sp. GP73]
MGRPTGRVRPGAVFRIAREILVTQFFPATAIRRSTGRPRRLNSGGPFRNRVGSTRQIGDISRSYDGLRAVGVNIVQGEAAAVDVPGRNVRLVGGAVLPYNRLVLSPGVDFIPDQNGQSD